MLKEKCDVKKNVLFFLCAAVLQPTCFSSLPDNLQKQNNRRFIAEVTYDGSDFAGWQSQPSKRSVQGTLNDVLTSTYSVPVKVIGASRTDKGVHARGQIIHFDLPITFSDADTIHAISHLNRNLPDDLKVRQWSVAPEGLLEIQKTEGLPFHAIENAISKHYSYEFSTSSCLIDPMMIRYRANMYDYKASQCMDVNAFQDALNVCTGTHDFRAFGNRLDIRAKKSEEYSGVKFSSIRTIYNATITEMNDNNQHHQHSTYSAGTSSSNSNGFQRKYSDAVFYRVDIVLDGALFKMLRNIIAGCVEVGYNTMSLCELQHTLTDTMCRADNRLVTAPACGLYLEKVYYPESVFNE